MTRITWKCRWDAFLKCKSDHCWICTCPTVSSSKLKVADESPQLSALASWNLSPCLRGRPEPL
ncbi:hypothetical protein FEV09_08160 [Pseudanabaena catenata USMAC16]|uniref:Uncharacterized protein n=1 Tax=Pseudanabaena catenata USMAC16 TaxID=1855837 RepID=A0A9X4RHS4_9CYAN|nr:hypothetical protein [Pseudanabaena catenata]MDG3494532.1 hypothetical protein [Pseudanabaena catenata USMAC16]